MKNILHFIPNFVFGGIESLFIELYKNIDHTKFNVSLMVESSSSRESIEYLESLGCKVYVIQKLKINHVTKYYQEVYKIFKENNFDVIHSHSPARSALILRAAKDNNIKVRINHAHTTEINDNNIKKLFYKILISIGNIFSTLSIAVSNKAGKNYFKNKKFLLLKNSIHTKKYRFDKYTRKNMRKKLDFEDKYILGHVGRFTTQKNHKYLIDIFESFIKLVPEAHLLLVGDGPLLETTKEYVEFKNLSNNVTFYGQTDIVNELYQVMDYFVFPSLYEGFPLTLIEVQSSGLKSVTTDTVDIPKEVNITGLVDFIPLDCSPELWAQQIFDGMEYNRVDNSEYMRDSEFDISNNIGKLEDLYR